MTKDYSSISKSVKQPIKKPKVNSKSFMVDLFRMAFLPKDTASVLYEEIREAIIEELLKGHRVNLFGVVILEPIQKVHNVGFLLHEKRKKTMRRIKTRVPCSFRTEWSKKFAEENSDV